MIRFFLHRNGVVGPAEETAARYMDVADEFFELLPQLIRCFHGRAQEVLVGWIPSLRAGCQDLLKAAKRHFRSAHGIRQLYKTMFDKTKRNAGTTPESLSYLSHELETSKGTEQLQWAQCIAFSLWTRFGVPKIHDTEPLASPDARGGGASLRGDQLKSPSAIEHMATVKVHRYKISQSTPPVVEANPIFLADPLGVTHMDVYNRGLDAALMCLRQLLIVAMQQMETGTQTGAVRENCRAAAIMLLTLKVKALRKDLKIGRAHIYKEVDVGMTLANDFVMTHKPDHLKIRSTLVQCDPHFADPRFLAEFVNNLYKSRPAHFPNASFMTTILDQASHQYHLDRAQTLNQKKLTKDMADLLKLTVDLADAFGVQHNEMQEFDALREMNYVFIPFYKRWRERQRDIITKMDRNQIVDTAKETVDGLIAVAKPELQPRQLPGIEEDGSNGALRHILGLIAVPVEEPQGLAIAAPTKKSKSATNSFFANSTFAALFDDVTDSDDDVASDDGVEGGAASGGSGAV
jgi:hypothetical protein